MHLIQGYEYPTDRPFRAVVSVPKGEGFREIRLPKMFASPLRRIGGTAKHDWIETVGGLFPIGDLAGMPVRHDAPLEGELFVKVDGEDMPVERAQRTEPQYAEAPGCYHGEWTYAVGKGIVLRAWAYGYAGGDWIADFLISNSDDSAEPLRSRHIEVRDGNGTVIASGILPPTYGKEIHLGSRHRSEFVHPIGQKHGVGPFALPSHYVLDPYIDESWLDEGGVWSGMFRPLGVKYGGMTSGTGIVEVPELCWPTMAAWDHAERYNHRAHVHLEDMDREHTKALDVSDSRFMRGRTGSFRFAEPGDSSQPGPKYLDPKSADDVRHFDAIDDQHGIRAWRHQRMLALRCADPMSLYMLEKHAEWAALKHRDVYASGQTRRDWGRAEAWCLSAMAMGSMIGASEMVPTATLDVAFALMRDQQPEGVFAWLSGDGGKIQGDTPYLGEHRVHRSQEQHFLARSLIEVAAWAYDGVFAEAALRCYTGMLDHCWWTKDSAGVVDRYTLGPVAGGDNWAPATIAGLYPTLPKTNNVGVYHDSYNTGNMPAFAWIAAELCGGSSGTAMELMRRTTGQTGILAARNALWNRTGGQPQRDGGQRLGRPPAENWAGTWATLDQMVGPTI